MNHKHLYRVFALPAVVFLLLAFNANAESDLMKNAQTAEKKTDYRAAAAWYRKAAEQGEWKAQEKLGYMLFVGAGITRDYSEAAKWFLKVADGDTKTDKTRDIESAGVDCLLGIMYENGWGVSLNYEEAAKRYRRPAALGYETAQQALAFLYLNGSGVEKSYAGAAEWFMKTADKGNSEAQNFLGVLYYEGKGVPLDYKKAVDSFRKSAEKGDRWGQYSLANCLYLGKGVQPDFKEAASWYKKSADQGLMFAQYNLGVIYDTGNGATKDHAAALKWFRLAARQGHEAARKTFLNQLPAADRAIGNENTLDSRIGEIRMQEHADSQARASQAEGCRSRCRNLFVRCSRACLVEQMSSMRIQKQKSLSVDQGAIDSLCDQRCSDQNTACNSRCEDFNMSSLHDGSNYPYLNSSLVKNIEQFSALLEQQQKLKK